ncbi:M23 family metallopeptidase [Novosphingobium sp.]|uniref:M23 family metallopeptidase n=1 Tax=Novosphingobium sp. TaxID=1874826 RepID=UPI002FDD66F5
MRAPQYQQATSGVQPVAARFQAPEMRTGPVAAALMGAAETLQQFAADKAKRDELAARTASGEAALAFQDQAGAIMAEATTARGLNAQAAHKSADEALREVQQKLIGGATSPLARQLIKQQTDAYLVGYRADLAKHETQQVFAAAGDTFGAQADAARQAAAQQWQNPQAVAAQVQIGRNAAEQQALLLGKSPEAVAQSVKDYESAVHRGTVEMLFAGGENDGALEYAKAHLDRMNLGDQTAIMGALKETAQNRQAYSDAQAAIAVGGPVPAASSSAKFTPPVRNGHITDAFGAARPGGRAHNGVDFAAPEGTSVTPIAPGTVVATGQDARSGLYVVVDHGGGLVSTYSHLGRQEVKGGEKVGVERRAKLTPLAG